MTCTKLFPSGALEISDVRNGQLVRRVYFDFTRKEAIADFRREFPLRKRGAK